jgi:hypothetical protein
MRSEKEVVEKIEYYRKQRDSFQIKSNAWNTYDAVVSAFEWVLHAPKEEPLTTIELKELREIMRERKQSINREATKQGYARASGGPTSQGEIQYPRDAIDAG